MDNKNIIPRRAKMYEWSDAEKAIFDAVQVVETMPADVRLTEAVTLLAQAQNKVADYIDSDQGKEWMTRNAKTE
jgi:hypothetical protein